MGTVRNKLIVLDVVEGDFDRGFRVFLRISDSVEFEGRLPPAPDMPQLYTRWQEAYYRWGEKHRWGRAMRLDFPPQTTNVSHWDDCNHAASALQEALKQWFDQPDMWRLVLHIVEKAGRHNPSRLIIRTHDRWLRRLPWHLWHLLHELPRLEIGISAQMSQTSKRLSNPVKLLAVLGNSEGIDTQVDLTLLDTLPHAVVHRLVQPTRETLDKHLYEHQWDMLFFAGHSRSEMNGETGFIWLNETDRLPLSDLKHALEHAVQHGLQLAIFNSCDGLGLARDLENSQIPYLIVMREPVPDRIAQMFLAYFLKAFAQGKPFHLAVRQARERLQSLEPRYPYASWLPVICQNPAAPVLKYPRYNPLKLAAIVATSATALIGMAMLLQQWHQDSQMRARTSLGERVLVTSSVNTDKAAGVTAFSRGDFSTAAKRFERSLQQNHNDPEARIYLNNALIGTHSALKIAVSVPIGSNTNVAQEILRGVAQAQEATNRQGGIGGLRLKVEITNDDNDPAIAKLIAIRLVKDAQVLAVVGHNASDASVAAAPIYIQGGLVMMTPTSFSDQLSSMGPYVFRMVPSIRFLADRLAAYYIKSHPDAKIAICSDASAVDNESYRNQFANGVLAQKIAHPNADLVQAPCDFSAKDFDPNVAITNLVKRGANTLLLAPHIDRINKATETAKANQGRLKLLASTSLYTAATLELGQASVNGLLLAVPWHPTMVPGNSFSQEAATLWGGSVNWRTAMAYDATQAIAGGLQQAIATSVQPNPTRDGLRDALRSSDFSVKGASGTIRFIQSGERQIASGFGVVVQVRPAPGSQFGYDFVPLASEK